MKARTAKVIIMSKDADFLNLLEAMDKPPQIIGLHAAIHQLCAILKKT